MANQHDNYAADLSATRPTLRAAWWADVVVDGFKAVVMVGVAAGVLWLMGVVR